MNSLFSDSQIFNDDISRWDVSNVTNMSYMFGNTKVFNQPIGDWDVSKACVSIRDERFGSGGGYFVLIYICVYYIDIYVSE